MKITLKTDSTNCSLAFSSDNIHTPSGLGVFWDVYYYERMCLYATNSCKQWAAQQWWSLWHTSLRADMHTRWIAKQTQDSSRGVSSVLFSCKAWLICHMEVSWGLRVGKRNLDKQIEMWQNVRVKICKTTTDDDAESRVKAQSDVKHAKQSKEAVRYFCWNSCRGEEDTQLIL